MAASARSRAALRVGVLASIAAIACTGSDPSAVSPDSRDGGTGPEAGVIDGVGAVPPAPPPPGCDATKSPTESPACIDDSFGIFVAPAGSDAAAGTEKSPVGKIATALDLAAKGGRPRIYVCGGTYEASFAITKGISIYGGLSCNDWTPAFAKTEIKATSSDSAVRIADVADRVRLADVFITGIDATDSGKSSIGVLLANAADVVLEGVTINAAAGANGTSPSQEAQAAIIFDQGGRMTTTATGAAGGVQTCADGVTAGGTGGTIGVATATPGLPPLGQGAAGVDNQNCAGAGLGGGGAGGTTAGLQGVPTASALGTLTADGWTPPTSDSGKTGARGQGGGGGGAGSGVVNNGGGGGAGGCGGHGGLGGGGGGASIAVAAFQSKLTVVRSKLTSAKGGNGGTGALGQPGQPGGMAGNGALQANGIMGCPGGPGGPGANGGGGAGGAGGLSVGILFLGTTPTLTDTTITPGTVGAKGIGAGQTNNDGPPGQAAETLAL